MSTQYGPGVMQSVVAEFVAEFTRKRSRSPSVEDICNGVGLRSPSVVIFHLRSMAMDAGIPRLDVLNTSIKDLIDRLVALIGPGAARDTGRTGTEGT